MASTSSNTALVIEPVVDKVKRWKRGKGDILRVLPPPPLEKNLFTPLVAKKIVRKKASRDLLRKFVCFSYKLFVTFDFWCNVASLLNLTGKHYFRYCNYNFQQWPRPPEIMW